MAFPAADLLARTRGVRPATLLAHWWRRLVEAVEAYPLERIGLSAVAAGIVLRIAAPFFMDFRSDGDTYVAMGHAWMLHHEFLMPYGDVTTWGPMPPGHSNHYPPAYPFYLGVVFTLFGYGLWQAKIAAVVVSLAALAAAYWTSRDLYGKTAGALAAGLVAVEPHLLWSTGTGFSENMVLLFFALTMWAILKSLHDDRYIVLAGLFAGLAYLSRASVGYFFVIAGLGGLGWRLWHRGWRVFTNVWYMLAIAIFGSIVGAWALRNMLLFPPVEQTFDFGFWSWTGMVPAWETSSYTRYVQKHAWERPEMWKEALVKKVPFFLAFAAWYVLPMLPESWRATKRIREEHTSALWLSVFLVWVIAWIISSMFWVFEQSGLYWFDNHRYVVIGLLPLGWLLLREARMHRASFRLRYGLLLLSLFAACGATFLSPVKFSDLRAAEWMDGHLQEGDEVAVDGGTIKYAFYAYLTRPETITIYGWTAGQSPHWVVSLKTEYDWDAEEWRCTPYEGYTEIGQFKQVFWNGGTMTTCLFARDDVHAQRGLPTGVLQVE